MKVSVLMATYNRGSAMGEPYLVKRAIESFLNQDYENSELIIYNDGSTDNTSQILKEYSSNPRIKIWESDSNSKPPNNWNIVWALSESDLICQLHDDDELTHNSLSLRVKKFKDNPKLQVVYGGVIVNNLSGTDERLIPGEEPDLERLIKDEYINFTSLMYRHNLPFRFEPDLRYYFDWLFKIRCLMECQVDYVKEPVMYYTVHQGQESNKCRRETMNLIEDGLMRIKLKAIYDNR